MLILILGLPGVGKTTVLARLCQRLGASSLHPGKHAWLSGLSDRQFLSRQELLKIPGLSRSFIAAVGRALSAGPLVLDGFPRTVEQARMLSETGWNLNVFHLVFPAGRELELSVLRQRERMQRDQVPVDRKQLEAECQLAMEHDAQAIELLNQLGHRVTVIDAMLPPDEVESAILSALGLG